MTWVLGIAGTAKNTGKTTTLNALVREIASQRISAAVTSIGYDGEIMDNVTGLLKPRVWLPKHTLAVVGEKCLSLSATPVRVLEKLPVETALGQLTLVRLEQDGLFVTSGPTQAADLRSVLQSLRCYRPQLVLVDGAFSRIYPFREADALVLASGAAWVADVESLARRTAALVKLLCLPRLSREQDACGKWFETAEGRFPLEQLGQTNGEHSFPISTLCLGGFFGMNELKQAVSAAPQNLVIGDLFALLALREEVAISRLLDELKRRGGSVCAADAAKLLAVTINPFYPRFRAAGSGDYQPAFVDDELLLREMHCVYPAVFNVMKEGGGPLWKMIMNKADRPAH